MKRLRLEATVFISGTVVMALELTGSRVVAPFLGTSLYVWTSLIGIILACLSLGYWWGGKIADEKPSYELLSSLLLTACGLVALITPLQNPVLGALSVYPLDRRISAVLATLVLFSGPSIVLGMITPFAIRLKLEDISHSGRVVGRLYALSTLGSIVGTFGAGFLLIAYLGTSKVILALALALLLASFIAHLSHQLVLKLLMGALIAIIFFLNLRVQDSKIKHGLMDFDTAYQRVLILTQEKNSRPNRTLVTDLLGAQSMMYLDAPHELAGEYTKFFLLAFHFVPKIERVLMLGGGAYTLPKHFAANYPEVKMDVVEIDPGITSLARQYFHLKDTPNLRIYHQDARTYLNSTTTKYETVFLDAFQSSPSVPFHLTTKETVEHIYNALSSHGILMMNIISAIEGEEGRFLRSEVATYRSVFPRVELFTVKHPNNGKSIQNIIITAFKSPEAPSLSSSDPLHSMLLAHLWQKEVPEDSPVLTDDFAPVEHQMLPALLAWHKKLRSE